jgi:sortase A
VPGATLTVPQSQEVAAGRPRRVVARRLLRDLSAVLIISGLLLLADAATTLLWQEPVTAVIALIERASVNDRYLSYGSAPLSPIQRQTLAVLPNQSKRIGYLARIERRELRDGDAVGRITIPRIGANFVVVQGTDETDLEKGPGHYPMTALPGMRQTVAIAGHRTTFLAPFRHIDALKPGDRIVVQMRYGRFVYGVQYHRIVTPTSWWVIRDVGYDRLVLSACNPLFSAAQRIVVFARLESVQASLAALGVSAVTSHTLGMGLRAGSTEPSRYEVALRTGARNRRGRGRRR